jgi:protein-S-isoprenylcysteine O-methyltransferase Ste14
MFSLGLETVIAFLLLIALSFIVYSTKAPSAQDPIPQKAAYILVLFAAVLDLIVLSIILFSAPPPNSGPHATTLASTKAGSVSSTPGTLSPLSNTGYDVRPFLLISLLSLFAGCIIWLLTSRGVVGVGGVVGVATFASGPLASLDRMMMMAVVAEERLHTTAEDHERGEIFVQQFPPEQYQLTLANEVLAHFLQVSCSI